MELALGTEKLILADRISRAQGRKARRYSATAKLTRDEHNELEVAARSDGRALGEWAREVLLREARGLTVNPAFTEIIAIRLLLNTALRGDLKTTDLFDAEVGSIRKAKHIAAREVMQQYADKEKSR